MADPLNLILFPPDPMDRRVLFGTENRRPVTVRKRIADLAVWAVLRAEDGRTSWPEIIKEIEWEVSNLKDAVARRQALNLIRAAKRKAAEGGGS